MNQQTRDDLELQRTILENSIVISQKNVFKFQAKLSKVNKEIKEHEKAGIKETVINEISLDEFLK